MQTNPSELPIDTQHELKLQEIGRNIRFLREMIQNQDKQIHTQAEFAQMLGISPGFLSQVEAGKKTPSLQLLLDIAEKTGRDLVGVLTGAKTHQLVGDFDVAIDFLNQANRLGVVAVEPRRDDALYRLCQFAAPLSRFDVHVTGSSLKGLQQDPNNPFVTLLANKRRKTPSLVQIHVLFTHMGYAFAREELEERTAGSIVREVGDGVLWALEKWNLEEQDIRFLRAPPTTFSIFINAHEGAVGLVNPYPVVAQAFRSPCLIVRRTGEAERLGFHKPAPEIFEGLHLENFLLPFWREIVVNLQDGIEECENCLGVDLQSGTIVKSPELKGSVRRHADQLKSEVSPQASESSDIKSVKPLILDIKQASILRSEARRLKEKLGERRKARGASN